MAGTALVGVGAAGFAGCLGFFDDCPDPNIDSELSYDSTRLTGRLVDEPPVTTVGLAASVEGVDQFDVGTICSMCLGEIPRSQPPIAIRTP